MANEEWEPLWSVQKVADFLGVPVATLYEWRTRRAGYGPKGVLIGRHLRYRPSVVRAWLRTLEDAA